MEYNKDMNNKKILITNIQRFSLHDGPGIRTTLFLKGCSLRCPWCSNPENLEHRIQAYLKDGVCGKYGEWYDAGELYVEVMKDFIFYEIPKDDSMENTYYITDPSCLDKLPGGVTFSGGEALLQIKELQLLLKSLKNERIHIAVETALFVPEDLLALSLQHIDLFYVDVKILDGSKCLEILQGDLELYFRNLNKLMNSRKPVVFRIPVIGNFTDGADNRKLVVEKVCSCTQIGNVLKIELIKGHDLGKSKYMSLQKAGAISDLITPEYCGVSDEAMDEYQKELENALMDIEKNIPVEICKL